MSLTLLHIANRNIIMSYVRPVGNNGFNKRLCCRTVSGLACLCQQKKIKSFNETSKACNYPSVSDCQVSRSVPKTH